jgi:hypothetical protein
MSDPAVFLHVVFHGWPILSLSRSFALAALRGQELIELAPLLVVLQLLFLFFLSSFFLDLLAQLRLVLLLFPVTTMMGERGRVYV